MNQFAARSYTSSTSRDIGGPQLCLLQRFLQAFIIMRPRDALKLRPCRRIAFPVEVTCSQASVVAEFTEAYKACCGMEAENLRIEEGEEISALGSAIRAQLHGLHPRLAPPVTSETDVDFELDQEDIVDSTAEELNQTY